MTIRLNYQNLFNYLIDTGICNKNEIKDITIDVKSSKNSHWVLNLPKYKIVVKQGSRYHRYQTRNQIANEWQICRFLRYCPNLVYTPLLTPEILHFDDDNSILIYKYPNDYINLNSFYEDNTAFPAEIAELVGRTLAKLHWESIQTHECYKFMINLKANKFQHQLLYADYLLCRIKPEDFSQFPVEVLKFMTFYQKYDSLREVVTKLVIHHPHCCLIQNNLQFNRILLHQQWESILSKTQSSNEKLIQLVDWERCSWGDPASDLGTVIAGYLLIWLHSMTVHPAIELEKSLQLATIPLTVIHPSTIGLTRAYLKNYPKLLEERPDFLKRVIQFTGLALIYHILETIEYYMEFNNQLISILQVAKSLLCQPEKSFQSVFGLTELALTESVLYSVN